MASTTMKLLVPLSTTLVAGAVALGSGAVWTSESATAVKVTGGDILHFTNGEVAMSIIDMKPGATETGVLTITNAGTLDSTVSLTEDTDTSTPVDDFGTLIDTVTPSLTRSITATWGSGATAGTDIVSASGQPFGDFTETINVDGTPLVLAPGETVTLTFVVSLDANALNSDQEAVLDAAYTIVTTQTAATNDETSIEDGWGSDLGTAENPGADRDESDEDPLTP